MSRRGKWPGLRVIGLTGGIASGKSTVSDMLAELGAVIIDADRLSREVTLPGSEGLRQVREAFGDSVITRGGTLDRHRLGAIIFHDESARIRLNSIIHPLVIELTEQRLRELQGISGKQRRPIVAVIDAPLLIEAGVDAICDEVWVVAVGRDIQARRLMSREGYTLDEALSRIDAQMPLSEKKKRATHIIDNEGTAEQTRETVLQLWAKVGI
jgi:dephospho-CoA kinase